MNLLNELLKDKDIKNKWNKINTKSKEYIIVHLFHNKTNEYCKLASKLLEFTRESEMNETRDIHANYVNLLCILLAKSHDPIYIKDIVKTKQTCDLFYYIDSNLLFEFSSKGDRNTCIQDTLKYVNSCDNKEKWFKDYKNYVNHYAKTYDESLIIKYWNRYKGKDYVKKLV